MRDLLLVGLAVVGAFVVILLLAGMLIATSG